MAKATAQQCHALTTYYMTRHHEATGHAPVVNRNKSRWGFDSILLDYSAVEARELIDYYTEHYTTPNIEWFLYNYEKVAKAKTEREETQIRNARRAKETEARLARWRERWQPPK